VAKKDFYQRSVMDFAEFVEKLHSLQHNPNENAKLLYNSNEDEKCVFAKLPT
jgi:hypothetical protein